MGLASLMILTAIASSNGQLYKQACVDKAVGDDCEYQSDEGTCCEMTTSEAGNPDKFCRTCDEEGGMTRSVCSVDSRQGYLQCLSNKEDAAVFQVCVDRSKGSECMYESRTSWGRHAWGARAWNTTGYCIAHESHKQVMCLEAVGGEDDGECNGKGVGQPCTHRASVNAVCARHPRRGHWVCLAPKEENMVFVICEGRSEGTPCSYTSKMPKGMHAGLTHGECHPHEDHQGMMCVDPAIFPIPTTTLLPSVSSESDGIPTTVVALIAACGAAMLVSIAIGASLCWKFSTAKIVVVEVASAPIACVVGEPVIGPNAVDLKV